ncbi:MAG: DUF4288 domain-containing protein [Chitinophagaceae bacterium]|nr:DUF4288 domain-containing protein [Chitinophagaceae bacterium]
MNWYMAKIVFRIICGEGNHTPQFEEQIRLIHATDANEAFEKARSIGETNEIIFLNHRRQEVQWQFVNVAELNRLSGLDHGAELFSHIHEADEAEQYIELINDKAETIRSAIFTPAPAR